MGFHPGRRAYPVSTNTSNSISNKKGWMVGTNQTYGIGRPHNVNNVVSQKTTPYNYQNGELKDDRNLVVQQNTLSGVGKMRSQFISNSAGIKSVRYYIGDSKQQTKRWVQLGSDIDGEAPGDWSGRSVSLNSYGTIVAIGARYNDGNGTNSGHVRVYKLSGNSWVQLGSDIDGEAPGDQSGYSVSLSHDGKIVAIGATSNDDNGTNSGHVRVYQWNDVSWIQLGSDIDGEAPGDQSGYSVSLSHDGKIVAIGATSNDDNGTNSGHVRVYQWNDVSWIQLGSDIDGEAPGDQSGHSVSLNSDGTIVAIGATLNDGNGANSGHVRVYELR